MIRPLDIAVLLLLARSEEDAPLTELAQRLAVSPAQVYQALQRAAAGRLVRLGNQRGRARQTKRLVRSAFEDVLFHAVRYVYPTSYGGEALGVPSFGAFAPTVFSPKELQPVWSDAAGEVRGLAIEPLYPQCPKAALRDPEVHKALACVDALRVGQARERSWATRELKKWLNP